MAKPAMWFDINAKDAALSRAFYKGVFGWDFNVLEPLNYGLTQTYEKIPGGIGQASEGSSHPSGVVVYFPVDDIETTLAGVEKNGGRCVVQPWELPGYGRMAVFTDPDGNRIGIWQV
ncbi:VOC family protein [Phyllobacterium sp. 628]|uniref:VOC family protein n=1 Tax=Phyllobacterium sp. 628 TaxID=2718938 RepID=UPI001FCF0944|nr:VOC family protein [Phyllobacterium sp. 628]